MILSPHRVIKVGSVVAFLRFFIFPLIVAQRLVLFFFPSIASRTAAKLTLKWLRLFLSVVLGLSIGLLLNSLGNHLISDFQRFDYHPEIKCSAKAFANAVHRPNVNIQLLTNVSHQVSNDIPMPGTKACPKLA